MSRFIVVAPGSSEAAALATEELARILRVTTVEALAGTTATDAALRPASALPAAVEAVRAAGDDALIVPAREASNRAFDHVAWNLSLAASSAPARHAAIITDAFSSMTPLSGTLNCPHGARCVRPDTTDTPCDLLKVRIIRYSVMVAFGSSTEGCVSPRPWGAKD